jgi:hypothetical protein
MRNAQDENQADERALIQEALDQARSGRTLTMDELIVEFKCDGLLPHSFSLDTVDEEPEAR